MNVATIHFKSAALERTVPYTAFIPDAARVGPGPYPVLLQLHGYSDDHRAWSLKSRLWEHAEHLPLIVVMPSGENSGYYNHYPPYMYEDMVVRDLRAHVLATLPARPGAWAIGGLSMGGFGAIRLGLKHPELFCSVWAHSSYLPNPETDERGAWTRPELSAAKRKALRTDMSVYHWAARLSEGRRPRLSFDCGVDDFLLEHNRAFHAHLDQIGFAHSYAEHPGAHTWDYWDEHVKTALVQHCAVLGIKPVART
jgi:putative tributyrin esterase